MRWNTISVTFSINSAVPGGTAITFVCYPPLKRWAIIDLSLTGRLCSARWLRHLGPHGCVMSSGFTNSSNFSAVSNSSSTADSFSEIPFLCAFLAILAALS